MHHLRHYARYAKEQHVYAIGSVEQALLLGRTLMNDSGANEPRHTPEKFIAVVNIHQPTAAGFKERNWVPIIQDFEWLSAGPVEPRFIEKIEVYHWNGWDPADLVEVIRPRRSLPGVRGAAPEPQLIERPLRT